MGYSSSTACDNRPSSNQLTIWSNQMLVIDITKKRFGRLVVISRVENNKHGKTRWECLCDCGKLTEVLSNSLRSGRAKSCGCLQKQVTINRNTTHNMRRSPEYYIWMAMKSRCGNKKSQYFKNYGGRGISVCNKWINSFQRFYEDMGKRPSNNHSLDRIDNNGNYELGNCQWATRVEQARNARSNHNITLNGRTLCIAGWAERQGISYSTLYARIKTYGWAAERALTEGVHTELARKGLNCTRK